VPRGGADDVAIAIFKSGHDVDDHHLPDPLDKGVSPSDLRAYTLKSMAARREVRGFDRPSGGENVSESRSQRSAVGASAGTGAVSAGRLARRGFNLILVSPNESAAESGFSVPQGRDRAIDWGGAADLSDKAQSATIETVLRDDASITMLVNNAGIATVALLLGAA
jgi:hypothetical protein